MIALLFITDRPRYAERTLASLGEMCPAAFGVRIVVNDEAHELGFAGAIAEGWRRVLETDAEYVFHLEDDFIFTRPVSLQAMCEALDGLPGVAQIALKRQAWNEAEREAGGIIEQHYDDFEEIAVSRAGGDDRARWPVTVHRRFFTTNPSIYRREIAERDWPQEPHSEGVFTHRLLADGYTFAFWGAKDDPPRVLHIGEERAGVGY